LKKKVQYLLLFILIAIGFSSVAPVSHSQSIFGGSTDPVLIEDGVRLEELFVASWKVNAKAPHFGYIVFFDRKKLPASVKDFVYISSLMMCTEGLKPTADEFFLMTRQRHGINSDYAEKYSDARGYSNGKPGSYSGCFASTMIYDAKKSPIGYNISPIDFPDVKVTGVTINKSELAMYENRSTLLKMQLVGPALNDYDKYEVDWTSSNLAIASVTDYGEVVARRPGEALVTVKVLTNGGTFTATSRVIVKADGIDHLEISEKDLRIRNGQQDVLKVYSVYKDGFRQDVSDKVYWQSSQASVASIVKGVMKANKVGAATIKATYLNRTASLKVVVEKYKPVKTLVVSNPTLVLREGARYPMRVIATYVDNTKEDVTSKVIWTIGNTDVVDVKSGKFYALDLGKTVVKGKFDGKLVSVNVNVR
jgi:hypothetical protein